MQEQEQEAIARENELKSKLQTALDLREQDRKDADIYRSNWYRTLDQLHMHKNDTIQSVLIENLHKEIEVSHKNK